MKPGDIQLYIIGFMKPGDLGDIYIKLVCGLTTL